MHFTLNLPVATALLLSLGVDASPLSNIKSRDLQTTTWKPTAFAEPASLTKSSNVVELKKVKSNSQRSAAHLKGLIPDASSSSTSGSTGLTSLIGGESFAIQITIGTQEFYVTLDTGSSDTWVVEKGFTCVDVSSGKKTSESSCGFGTPYAEDSTFSKISGETFSITYGDGEYLEGIVGTEHVTIAGITVTNQTIALGTSTGWEGDGTTSGLTGFSYPAITSAYSSSGTQEIYDPVFVSMYKQGLVDSYFSLAILRDVSGSAGYLTLGGLPPIDFNETFTSTPILVTSISGYPNNYDFYTIEVDSINLKGKALSSLSNAQYIVDSGTTLNYYPNSVAKAINAAFSPAATYSSADGAYIVDCDATPPAHSITIGGTEFTINPLDMILNVGTDSCISGITNGGTSASSDLFILGDTFQKNVVSVFDVGAAEMKFAAHVSYTSNDTY